MKHLHLKRAPSAPYGTLGAVTRDDGSFFSWSMELPWRENARGASCIPAGKYLCRMRMSPKHGKTYEVVGVPYRSNILIHSGNVAGYPTPPYETHSLGCLLLGQQLGMVRGQLAVLVSRPAISALEREMSGQPFILEVTWAFSIS